MNRLRASFAPYWQSIQHALFPQLEHVLGPLTAKQQQLVRTLEVIRIERWIPGRFRVPGRPPKDRAAIARAFVAKAVYDMPTTRVLLDRLDTDVALRRICGWEKHREVPSESVFSRAFAEFAHTQLPDRVHQALIRNTHLTRWTRAGCAASVRTRSGPKLGACRPPGPCRGPVHPGRPGNVRQNLGAGLRGSLRGPMTLRTAAVTPAVLANIGRTRVVGRTRTGRQGGSGRTRPRPWQRSEPGRP